MIAIIVDKNPLILTYFIFTKLKERLIVEDFQLLTNCQQLKMTASYKVYFQS